MRYNYKLLTSLPYVMLGHKCTGKGQVGEYSAQHSSAGVKLDCLVTACGC